MSHLCFTSWKTWDDARGSLIRLLDPEGFEQVETAFRTAVLWQAGQLRPGGEPNEEHLLEVLEILVVGAGVRSSRVLAAAATHDVIEDSACTLEILGRAVGPEVAALVAVLTDPEPRPGETPEQVRRRYLSSLRTAPDDAVTVKLADRYSNVQRLHLHPDPAWRRHYYRETCEHVVPLSAGRPFFADTYAAWRRHYGAWSQ